MALWPFGRAGQADRPVRFVGDHADKLSRVPAIPHDPDERPTREDMQARPGIRLFQIPVPVPKFLTPRRDRLRR
jgi:hypothetical protein